MSEAIHQYPLLHHSGLHIIVLQHHILLQSLQSIEHTCGHLLGKENLWKGRRGGGEGKEGRGVEGEWEEGTICQWFNLYVRIHAHTHTTHTCTHVTHTHTHTHTHMHAHTHTHTHTNLSKASLA